MTGEGRPAQALPCAGAKGAAAGAGAWEGPDGCCPGSAAWVPRPGGHAGRDGPAATQCLPNSAPGLLLPRVTAMQHPATLPTVMQQSGYSTPWPPLSEVRLAQGNPSYSCVLCMRCLINECCLMDECCLSYKCSRGLALFCRAWWCSSHPLHTPIRCTGTGRQAEPLSAWDTKSASSGSRVQQWKSSLCSGEELLPSRYKCQIPFFAGQSCHSE